MFLSRQVKVVRPVCLVVIGLLCFLTFWPVFHPKTKGKHSGSPSEQDFVPLGRESDTSDETANAAQNRLTDVSPSIYEKFLQLRRNYESKMADIPRLRFKSRDEFITYGKPVADLLPEKRNKIKRILQWTTFFGRPKWMPDMLRCPNNIICSVSFNKSDIFFSDAVLFHSCDLKQPPSVRLQHQRWIHYTMEAPYRAFIDFKTFNNFYNWTLTYRGDSDFQHTYFSTEKRPSTLTESKFTEMFLGIYNSKSKLIAHMNSNCDTKYTRRLAYVSALAKYIPVDRYGKCGNLSCEKQALECTEIMKKYKFYMAMENSNCRDYITEKAREPLFDWGSVPVVMGGADPGDYERQLPPNSYIHTSGFDSPEELAEYLLLLDKHPTLYAQYHRWRMTHQIGKMNAWCQMCTMLNDDSLPSQTYRDFNGWYIQDSCIRI